MGMFDNVRCDYPLPVEGCQGRLYQSKDTPAQFLDSYEIRADGTLWHQAYDIEDKSNLARWSAEHPGETPPAELMTVENSYFGSLARVNTRWEYLSDFSGEVRISCIPLKRAATGWGWGSPSRFRLSCLGGGSPGRATVALMSVNGLGCVPATISTPGLLADFQSKTIAAVSAAVLSTATNP